MRASSFIGKQCLIFHRWVTVKDNGFTCYKRCKDCGKRLITQPENSGYQPIDWDWLFTGKENIKEVD